MSVETEVKGLAGQGLTPTHIAQRLGMTRGQVRHILSKSPSPDGDCLPVEYRGTRPLTLPELIAYYKIDQTEWEVQSWKANVWEQGTVGPDGRVQERPLHQTSATFRRIKNANATLLKGILEEIRSTPKFPSLHLPHVRSSPTYMVELCLFDLHLAKLAWGEETGGSYDMQVAIDRATRAVYSLLRQASALMDGRKPSTILLPLGNDYFHYDHISGLTTAGTPQDRDSRYHKMFRAGRRLASEMIRHAACYGEKVRVVMVPGNHDRLSIFTMGEVLGAEFDSHPNITIDNSPPLRKYVRSGQVLIGYTHGSDEKVKSLPQLMATEQREAWGKTSRHEWHIGHLHKRGTMETVSVNEEMGCVTRYISSLSGTDAWHYSKGYVGNAPAAECFVWDTEKGHLMAHLIAEAG